MPTATHYSSGERTDLFPQAAVRLLEFRRGRGISVTAGPEQGAVVEQARNLVQFARRQGYPLDELIKVIETIA